MKLAEAPVPRADSQKKVLQLRQRLERVVKVQKGEAPALFSFRQRLRKP